MTVPLAILGFRGAGRFHSEIQALKSSKEAELTNLANLIRQVSRKGDQVFEQPHEASRTLQFSFDLENGQDASAAAAAALLDDRVAQTKTRLVDGEATVDEQNFFFNYFSHVAALLAQVFSRGDSNEDVIELQNSIRALIRVEDCAPAMAYLSWSMFNWESKTSLKEDASGKLWSADENQQKSLSLLEPIIIRFQYSRSDIVTLAGCIAIEEMGGPKIAWRGGRADSEESECYVDVETYFTQQERVVLRWLNICEKDRAGAKIVSNNVGNGNGNASPVRQSGTAQRKLRFDNSYFEDILLSESLVEKPTSWTTQEESDRDWAEVYASDETRFVQDFTFAYTKLQEWKFRFPPKGGRMKKPVAKPLRTGEGESLENGESGLSVKLPDDLAMFRFSAAQALPATSNWRNAVLNKKDIILQCVRLLTVNREEAETMLQKVTSTGSQWTENGPSETESRSRASSGASCDSIKKDLKGKVKLDVFKKPHPKTSPREFVFDLDDPNDRNAAIAAGNFDPTLTKFKPSLVPKISEKEFYYNYFSHVYQLRRRLGDRDKPKVIKVFVGSSNPVKVNACKRAFFAAFQGQNKAFEFHGVEAPSGVSDQPMGDAETKTGAINRARYCMKNYGQGEPSELEYFVGIEGGIIEELTNPGGESSMMCCAWVAILSSSNVLNCSRTATFNLPPALSSLVKKGIELGRADDIVHGTTNSKQKGGTVGTLTQGLIDRTLYYKHAAILALAPFSNPSTHI